MSKTFPSGMNIPPSTTPPSSFSRRSTSVYHTLFEAAILVLIVIMVFLQNLRAMLVPATTVPVTIIGAFAAMADGIQHQPDDAVRAHPRDRHRRRRRHHHRRERVALHREGLTPKDAAIKAMSELTGPVIGITLVLTAVFVPAAFLPGITGQLFRQFALVIAATAVISAINAVTLKPAQCALYLKPKKEGSRPNAFYRGFNKALWLVEGFYVGIVSWMAHRVGLMMLVFFGHRRRCGGSSPTADGPTEDQGYCIIAAKLPDGAAQPRARAVADKINDIVEGAGRRRLGDGRRSRSSTTPPCRTP